MVLKISREYASILQVHRSNFRLVERLIGWIPVDVGQILVWPFDIVKVVMALQPDLDVINLRIFPMLLDKLLDHQQRRLNSIRTKWPVSEFVVHEFYVFKI